MELKHLNLLFSLIFWYHVSFGQVDKDYLVFKNKADACFNSDDFNCAKINYEKALTIKSGDTYCIQKIKESNQKIKEQNQVTPKVKNRENTNNQNTRQNTSYYGNLTGLTTIYGSKYNYQGMILDNKPNGKGQSSFEDGSSYFGSYSNGWIQGLGKRTYSNGDIYEGNWILESRQGTGKYSWADGAVYEGDWIKDKLHGKGKYTWPDGAVYEGDWIDGKQQGIGQYTWPDGTIYKGGWIADSKTGFGIITAKNGFELSFLPRCIRYEGNWKNGKKHGKGKCYDKNGTLLYDGEFIEGKPVSKYPMD